MQPTALRAVSLSSQTTTRGKETLPPTPADAEAEETTYIAALGSAGAHARVGCDVLALEREAAESALEDAA